MKHTLPTQEIEVPRMGLVVYVSPKIGIQDHIPTVMFTAEIKSNDSIELQSFHYKCKDQAEAETTRDNMSTKLTTSGPYPFIQTKI